ncbi:MULTISPECIES: GIY-YIG nuclease family protein [Paenibacillus]|uniref:GIY-YIG nuclease family protein n=1 Tax=Paenibacillus TaxID=44249 RepID=UPI00203F6858|nr:MULTISPECIES: GIY-YIG nuclease family protein [Paenibacillus]
MNNGFIYILINESLKGLVKIGKTSISSSERARQLSSSTGVPTPFRVAYEIFSEDCDNIEKTIHLELNDFRVNPNREFFQYPLNKAIEVIQKCAKRRKENEFESFESIEILPKLKEMFTDYLNPSVSSVRFYQTTDRVYLEVTQDEYIADYLKNQYIRRTDLGFIINDYDEDDKFFKPERTINYNVEKFLASDFTTMAVCSDDLFTKDAEDEVCKKQLDLYNEHASTLEED